MNYLLTIATVVFSVWVLRRMVPGHFVRLGSAYQDQGDFDNAERMFLTVFRIESWISQFHGRNRGFAIAHESLGVLLN